MVRAGVPFELFSRQLGHRDVVMVAEVYGRFVPSSQLWGVADEKVDEVSEVTPDPDDSRGGTRTHDPGIMRRASSEGETPPPSEDAP